MLIKTLNRTGLASRLLGDRHSVMKSPRVRGMQPYFPLATEIYPTTDLRTSSSEKKDDSWTPATTWKGHLTQEQESELVSD